MTGFSFAAKLSRAACVGCLVSFAASAAFAAPASAAKAGECLSRPRGAAPQGERWYYRVERTTQRHCWYTRAGAPRSVIAQKPPPAEPVRVANTPEPAPEPLLPAVANARAEADLSAAPTPPVVAATSSELPPTSQSDDHTGSLADRWPDRASERQFAQLQPKVQPPAITPSAARTQIEAPAQLDDDSLWAWLIIASVAATLVGFAVPPIVSYLRSREQNRFYSGDSDEESLPFALPREVRMELPRMRAGPRTV